MMKNILSMAMLSLLASSAFAMSEAPKVLETDIVFTNSTLDTLDVSLSGDASAVQTSYQVAPLATATLAKLTRSSGTNSALNIQQKEKKSSVEEIDLRILKGLVLFNLNDLLLAKAEFEVASQLDGKDKVISQWLRYIDAEQKRKEYLATVD